MAHKLPPDHLRCKGTSKSSGERCPMWAIKGGTVCYHHGGAAPQTKAAAAQRIATRKIEQDVEAVLAHEGIEGVADPLQELSKLASSSQALMNALGARVNSLDELEHFDAKNSPAIKAEVQMYERAMDRTARLLSDLVRHGFTERQIKIEESEAMLVAGVLRRVIAAMGLSAEQQKTAQVLLAAEFRALSPRAVPAAG